MISSLREKPHAHRERVAIVAALSITAVIGLMWLATLPMRLSIFGAAKSEVRSEVGVAAVIAGASDAASAQVDSLQDSWQAIQTMKNQSAAAAALGQTTFPQSDSPSDAASAAAGFGDGGDSSQIYPDSF